MRGKDADIIQDARLASQRGASVFAHALLLGIAGFFAVFLYWAHQATLDEVTRGDGKVVPSGKTQVVQNLEGGIVGDLLVREGQIVDTGQVLLRIENTLADSEYREARSRYLSLLAQVARLRAETSGGEIEMPEEVLKEAPAVAQAELALMQSRRDQLDSQIRILKDQASQRKQELRELAARDSSLTASLKLADEELDLMRPMVEKGVAARVELIRLERQKTELSGELQGVRLSIPRAKAALNEAENRIRDKRLEFVSEARRALNEHNVELASLGETIKAERDRVVRTDVRSPVHGTIKQLNVNTIGGVVRPGADLLEIVPLEDTLLVEAQIRPQDIAFLRPGQEAMVKVTAYDFSIYGGLDATLEQISADTITDEKGESFYRIYLRTEKNHLGKDNHPLPIIPGMITSVDILTGHKTVLDYLLKPILKARQRALRER
jgi:adhesin transport system membrane fusion protein